MFKKDQRAALYFTVSDLVHFKNDNVQGIPGCGVFKGGIQNYKVFG